MFNMLGLLLVDCKYLNWPINHPEKSKMSCSMKTCVKAKIFFIFKYFLKILKIFLDSS